MTNRFYAALCILLITSLYGCADSPQNATGVFDVLSLLDSNTGEADIPSLITDISTDIGPAPTPSFDCSEPFGPGCECNENSDCTTGWCVQGPQGSICTIPCIDSCPDGFHCQDIANAGGKDWGVSVRI